MMALCFGPTQLQVAAKAAKGKLPSLVLLLGAAAGSVTQPTFFT